MVLMFKVTLDVLGEKQEAWFSAQEADSSMDAVAKASAAIVGALDPQHTAGAWRTVRFLACDWIDPEEASSH
jgi:hypothetical protein